MLVKFLDVDLGTRVCGCSDFLGEGRGLVSESEGDRGTQRHTETHRDTQRHTYLILRLKKISESS